MLELEKKILELEKENATYKLALREIGSIAKTNEADGYVPFVGTEKLLHLIDLTKHRIPTILEKLEKIQNEFYSCGHHEGASFISDVTPYFRAMEEVAATSCTE